MRTGSREPSPVRHHIHASRGSHAGATRPTSAARALVLGLIALGLLGCDGFASPAELAATQVLAIRAEPPAVAPGQSAELEILVAGPGGPVAAPDIEWAVVEAVPGEAPLGTIESLEPGRARYTAPESVPEVPALGSVEATVRVGEGEDLQAIKGVIIADLALVNPTMTGFSVDGQDGLAGSSVSVPGNALVTIEMVTDPPITDDSTFAWYATVGAIERYQSNPAEIDTTDATGAGWLIGVTRDGRGGVVWHAIEVAVE